MIKTRKVSFSVNVKLRLRLELAVGRWRR